MKTFIGNNTVKASLMSMYEAYECGLLAVHIAPAECEKDIAGYYVEHEDGSRLWCPANVFQKTYQPADTPLERMVIEQAETLARYQKGKTFLNGEVYAALPYMPKVLLAAQNATQREYSYLLADRISQMSQKSVYPTEYDFGTAIKLLQAGGAVRRAGWDVKGMFVIKQVPAHITEEIIPKMQSLPQIAKDILMNRQNPHIDYANQMLMIYPDGHATSWMPTTSDIFAEDWELVTECVTPENR